MKIYTNESKLVNDNLKSPKKSVIDNILNYSKALEVIKTKSASTREIKNVELLLN